MEFSYIAVDITGTKQKGLLEANGEKEVLDYLRTNKLLPLTVKKKAPTHLSFVGRITSTDIVFFTRQLSSMITTGLTLIEALQILKQENTKPQMQKVIENLIASISEGSSFSSALENHKKIFSEVYIALIKAAESSGLLDKVLERLAENLEKIDDLKKRVRGALFYPVIVLIAIGVVITIMNIFIIPQLGKLYESLNLKLPLSTQIVLAFSKLFTTFYPLIIPAFIVLFFLFKQLQKTELGIDTVDRVKLRIPVLGGIIRLTAIDEITRTLSLLIGAGTSILEALNITKNVSGNIYYKDAIRKSTLLVEKGVPLSMAFAQQQIFPPIVIQMTKVGETTGKIDENLLRVSEYFERDLDIQVKTLTTSIEPFLIVVLGVIVGFLVLSVITPIYSLISQIQ